MTPDTTDENSVDRLARRAAEVIAGLLAAFVIWTAIVGNYPNIQQRAVVLGFVFAIGYLLFPTRIRALGEWSRLIDAALFLATAAACAYVVVNYYDIMMFPEEPGALVIALGILLCLSIFELSRRTIGWSFGILMLIFAAYVLWGHLIPGRLGHAPVRASLLIDALYLGTDGIWGQLMDVYASLLVLFVIFSGLMMATGGGQTFMDLGKLVAGRLTGGPAKIAVVTSALIGSVTGSSVTNVAMTGSFTIPMMKRLGYRPEVAGAIEATASSGGQITPPMMGAGLFLMAELLGMGIGKLMLVAAVPALLFYVSVLAAVHFESCREQIAPLQPHELPDRRLLWSPRLIAPVILPFASLIGALMIGYSPQRAILLAMAALVLAYILAATSLREVPQRIGIVIRAVAECAMPLVTMGVLIAAAALVVAIIGFFGIGPKLSELVVGLGRENLVPTLVLSGMVVIVIGMGVPTTAAYVLGASVIVIALERLGVSELSAHMFIFYFATLSALTPPVCAAVFVAANIAQANWLPVAWQTVRFAVIKYLLPFMFVFHPELLLTGTPLETIRSLAFAIVGALGLSAAFAGFLFARLRMWESVVIAVASVATLWPEPVTSLLGLVPLAAVSTMNWLRKGPKAGAKAT